MIIPVDFSQGFFESVRNVLPKWGAERTVSFLVEQGEHPRFAEVIVRRAVRSLVAR
jgi:hypothetical protein